MTAWTAPPRAPSSRTTSRATSGTRRKADERARESLQLQVYALAWEAETGELPRSMELHFLDSGVVGRVLPDAKRLDRARRILAQAADGHPLG